MSVPLGWCAPTKTVGDAFVSSVWVSGACFTLAALLVLLALAAVFLVALELASNKRRGEWKLRPIASGVLALMCVLESVFFFSFPGDFWRVAGAYYLLATLPGVLVASALYLCSYLFGSIFHDVYFSGLLSDTEIAVRKARRAKTHLFLSVAVAGAQLLLWGLSFALPNATYEQIQVVFSAALGIGSGLAFPLYLFYLVRKRKRLAQPGGRVIYQHRLLQVLTVAVLASVCSIGRGVVVLLWRPMLTLVSRQLYWVVVVCAYSLTDLLPVAYMLVLFKVVSFKAVWFVGTSDDNYWSHTVSQQVAGHDFDLLVPGTATSEGELSTPEDQYE